MKTRNRRYLGSSGTDRDKSEELGKTSGDYPTYWQNLGRSVENEIPDRLGIPDRGEQGFRRHDGDENERKSNRLNRQNKKAARTSRFFFFSYISLPSLHDFERFMGDANKWRRNFFLSLNLNVVVRNSAPKEFACIWQRTRVEIILIETERTQIHFLRDVFVAVAYNHNFNKFSNLTGYEQPWVDHHARALESLNV